MEYRNLNITLVSVNGLKKSRFTGSMHVYAVVFISGGKGQKQRTNTDKYGDSNPTWNVPMKFVIDEEFSGATLVFKLKEEAMFGGKNLGEVHVPVKELLEGFKGNGKAAQTASYEVLRRPSGKPNGVLSFKYEFRETFTTIPRGMGEKPAGYGYQNQHPGCVYYPRRPRPVVPPRRCSSMGFGFGNSSMGFGFIGDYNHVVFELVVVMMLLS
ncbi:protein SRC2 homolog [Bidens hawaiensis]|uniref:protein SRC2 homolog n=1 Tax=Bidens hawaiensis TaxID=980011 RepID=UPI0040498644